MNSEAAGNPEGLDHSDYPDTTESYIYSALDELGKCSSLLFLVPRQLAGQVHGDDAKALQAGLATKGRALAVRSAVVWTAFAVEAMTNEYADATLSPADNEPLRTLSTVNRLVLAPRLATGEPVFERGASPLTELTQLFKVRNRFAHPRASNAKLPTPSETVRYLIAAADARLKLLGLAGRLRDAPPPQRVWEAIEYSKHWLQTSAARWDNVPDPRVTPTFHTLSAEVMVRWMKTLGPLPWES